MKRILAAVLCLCIFIVPAFADYVVSPNSAPVNLRQTEKGQVIGKIVTGTWVTVLVPGDEWTKVRYRDTEGYIRTEYLTEVDPVEVDLENNPYMYIISPNSAPVNIRQSDSEKSKIIGYLVTGTRVEVKELGDVWAEIEYGGEPGYVMRKFVQRLEPWMMNWEIDPGIYYIKPFNGAPVNLRGEPSRNSKVVAQLVTGTVVSVVSVDWNDPGDESPYAGWAFVETDAGSGYVMTYYLTQYSDSTEDTWWFVSSPEQGSVNMRYGAGKGYDIVISVPNGTGVARYGTVNGWARVKWGIYEGYIDEQYLTDVIPE